ncbi:chemotaxis protein CheD [Candidatus Woesearchaeota archaeon]|nr:chemotaxis protein CheD [Candidatus Woesearchaeota archaeon]
MSEKISVNIAECRVAEGNSILESIGVGSCVVVCLYDAEKKIGGLAHILLPGRKSSHEKNPLRFAHSALDALIGQMRSLGCRRIVAKIFGGASMFPTVQSSIGDDNVKSARKKLHAENIQIRAEDVGGSQGRSIWFEISTGRVVVGKVYGETKEY